MASRDKRINISVIRIMIHLMVTNPEKINQQKIKIDLGFKEESEVSKHLKLVQSIGYLKVNDDSTYYFSDETNDMKKARIAKQEPIDPVFEFPVRGNDIWYLERDYYNELLSQSVYDKLDLMEEFELMKQWLLASKRNLKTPDGMRRFVNGWLSKSIRFAASNGLHSRPPSRKNDDLNFSGEHILSNEEIDKIMMENFPYDNDR